LDALSPREPSYVMDGLSLADIRELQAHPQFRDAAIASARASIDAYHGGRLMNWIMSDRARALLGYLAYYLELTSESGDENSGLTPTRLKRACAETGLCSPGRGAAMLALMRAAGYVALVTDPADRRVRRLVATDKLKDMLRLRLAPQLAAAAVVMPELGGVSNLLGNGAFERALMRWFGDRFFEGQRLLVHAPELMLFAEHNAGVVILFNLMLSDPSGTFPPRGPVQTSVAGLARRFKVSRTHVLRLLRAAERQGHIKRTGEHYDRLILNPHLTQAALNLFATMYPFLAMGVAAAKAKVS
jgi:DNA-binding MarR family transcriptional regulator